jgi:hypothetical protein
MASWIRMMEDRGAPSTYVPRRKKLERLGPAAKAALVMEYQRAMLQRSGNGERWVSEAGLKLSSVGDWLRELGFTRRVRDASPATKIAALEELAAMADETQAVRWLLKRGIPSKQARTWLEHHKQGHLELPARADLMQARRAWERPQLSPEQKRDRINEYVTTLSETSQTNAGQWLRDQRLTWWELEDWYREPGVVTDQDRDIIAPVFDGPAAQATAPAIPADHVEIDAGEGHAGPVQGWAEDRWGLEPALGTDPLPAPPLPAGPSHYVPIPADPPGPAATEANAGAFPGEANAGAFPGPDDAEMSSSGGSNSPDRDSLYHQLFQENGDIRPEILPALDSFLNGPDHADPGADGSGPGRGDRPVEDLAPQWQAQPWWQTHHEERSQLPAGSSHYVPISADLPGPAAIEANAGAFPGSDGRVSPALGGPDSPNAELLCRQLFQEDRPVEDIEMVLRGEPFLPESPLVPSPVLSPVPRSGSNPFDLASLLANPEVPGATASGTAAVPGTSGPHAIPPASSPTQWWTRLVSSSEPTPDTKQANSTP